MVKKVEKKPKGHTIICPFVLKIYMNIIIRQHWTQNHYYHHHQLGAKSSSSRVVRPKDHYALFANKRIALNEMFEQKYFKIWYILCMRKPSQIVFFIMCNFIFLRYECMPILCQHRPRHSKGKRLELLIMKKEMKFLGFLNHYTT